MADQFALTPSTGTSGTSPADKARAKRELTKARNKLNEHRYRRSLEDEAPPDLSEALSFAGLSMFKLDDLQSLPEVIRPLLARYESWALGDMEKKVQNEVPGFAKHKKTLPTGLVDDIYNLFFVPPSGFTFVAATLANGWRINLLQQLSHYYMRALTERSSLFSYIVTQELTRMLLEELNPPEDPQPGDPDAEESLSKLAEAGGVGAKRDAALDKAQDRIDKVAKAQKDGLLPKDGESGGDSGSTAPGSTGSELEEAKQMLELLEMMKNVTISSKTLNQFIKQTLSMSTTYFSDKYTESEIDLFDADQIDDIAGLENLVPQLLAIGMEEMVTHERKYRMGFDVYIDRSGSMTGRVQGRDSMTGIDLVKLTACILLRKGLVRNVYFFDTVISKPHRRQLEVLQAREGGGTRTEIVLQQITKIGSPALVLTDMQDNITTYTPLAYFVGVLGARMYDNDTGTRYLNRGQFSSFDGTTLKLVKP